MLINHKAAALTASIMCLLIGMIVLIHFHSNRGSNIDINEIAEALRSSHIPTRIAALKTVQQKKLEISAYPTYSLLYQSQIPQERYWFVRALAVSRRPDSIRDLLTFINDKNTNVRCMAFRSLGLRNNTDAVGPILESIRVSQDWYSQIYAYKALRALGWNQTKLP
jgi:HEAT repeat protein